MNPQRLIMLVVALVVAGGTVFFLKQYLTAERMAAQRTARPVAEPVKPAQQVLVARVDIRTGQIVKPDDLRWQAWPEGTLSPAYVVEGRRPLSDFVGAVARSPVSAGEPITEGRVVLPGSRGFMAAVLQPGMRAVTVPVSPTSGIAGFVFAGDKVDLVLTHTIQPSAAPGEKETKERPVTETILHDIRVIAMDQRPDSKPGEPAQVAKTATLEVTPKQTEIITLAQEMGKLSLSLRSLQEPSEEPQPEGPSFTRDTEVSYLLARPSAPTSSGQPTEPPPPAPSTAAPPPPAPITIIRGSTVADSVPSSDTRSGSGGGAKP